MINQCCLFLSVCLCIDHGMYDTDAEQCNDGSNGHVFLSDSDASHSNHVDYSEPINSTNQMGQSIKIK